MSQPVIQRAALPAALFDDAPPPAGLGLRAGQPCFICGVQDRPVPLADLGEYRVHRCPRCRGESVSPLPEPEALSAAYHGFDAGRIGREHFHQYAELAERMLAAELSKAGLRFSDEGHSASFLDYGCGAGHFVRAAGNLGFRSIGVEFDPVSVSEGRKAGLDIREAGSPDRPETLEDETFDAILMFHVLEHVTAPFRTLAALADRLRPGGVLLIEVPDQESLPSLIKRMARLVGMKKREWGYVQPPIHLHGLSRRSFEVVARELGLTLHEMSRVSPLDPRKFPSNREYWRYLRIQQAVYRLARVMRSPGYLFVVLKKESMPRPEADRCLDGRGA